MNKTLMILDFMEFIAQERRRIFNDYPHKPMDDYNLSYEEKVQEIMRNKHVTPKLNGWGWSGKPSLRK